MASRFTVEYRPTVPDPFRPERLRFSDRPWVVVLTDDDKQVVAASAESHARAIDIAKSLSQAED